MKYKSTHHTNPASGKAYGTSPRRRLSLTTYQAGILQSSAHRVLQKYCDEVLNEYGITKSHWLAIGTLLDAGPNGLRVSELANSLDTTVSYITTTIHLLESKGMLCRRIDEDDSRVSYISVEPDFVSTCIEIEDTLRQALRDKIYSWVDRKELEIYMKVLDKIANR